MLRITAGQESHPAPKIASTSSIPQARKNVYLHKRTGFGVLNRDQWWWNVAASIGTVNSAMTFADPHPQSVRCTCVNCGAQCAFTNTPMHTHW